MQASANLVECRDLNLAGRVDCPRLTIHSGQWLSLLGPNGSGKSSLLNMLSGVQSPDQGEILFDGSPMQQIRAAQLACFRSYLGQRYPLPFAIPVYDLVLMGLAPLARSAADPQVQKALTSLCKALELTHLLGRPGTELSGGELQRVMLAKTLLQCWPGINPDARLVLLDEPLTGLDLRHQLGLTELLLDLNRLGLTVVLAIHDLSMALQLGGDALLLSRGKPVHSGPIEQVLTPARVKQVYGVETRLVEVDGRNWLIPQ